MADQPDVEVIGERKINWWLVIGGVVLLIFAVGTFAYPMVFLDMITILAGIGFVVSGVTGVIAYAQMRPLPGSGWTLLMGVLDAVVGVMMLVHPFAFAVVLPWMLGVLFIAFGVVEIAGMVPFGMLVPESRPIVVVSGILTVVVGIMFIIWPTSLSLWVAAFAAVRAITLIAMGFMSRV